MFAFFDFIDWLDTQATLDPGFDLEQAKKFYGEWLALLVQALQSFVDRLSSVVLTSNLFQKLVAKVMWKKVSFVRYACIKSNGYLS